MPNADYRFYEAVNVVVSGAMMTDKANENNQVIIAPELARELARQLLGSGRRWMKPGDDPIGDLVREREQDDELDRIDNDCR